MSKEKQIDIIAKIIMTVPPLESTVVGRAQGKRYYTARHIAKYLVENGVVQHRERYLLKENGEIVPLTPRSEWISVDERLPEEKTMVLGFYHVVYKNGGHHDSTLVMELRNGLFVPFNCSPIRNGSVTHWMPLPEAPKKGGVQE